MQLSILFLHALNLYFHGYGGGVSIMTSYKNITFVAHTSKQQKICAELIARGYVDSAKTYSSLAAHTNQQQNSCRINRMVLHWFCKNLMSRWWGSNKTIVLELRHLLMVLNQTRKGPNLQSLWSPFSLLGSNTPPSHITHPTIRHIFSV